MNDKTDVRNVSAMLLDGLTEGRPTFFTPGGPVPQEDMRSAVAGASQVLEQHAVRPSDRVLLLLPDSPALVAYLLAVMQLEAVAVPLNPLLAPSVQLGIEKQSGSAIAICGEMVQPEFLQANPGNRIQSGSADEELVRLVSLGSAAGVPVGDRYIDPHAPALLQYTSGSTGQSKGVVHTHGSVSALRSGFGAHISMSEKDRVLSAAKASFGYGMGNSILFPLFHGTSSILVEEMLDPIKTIDMVQKTRPSILFAVPRLLVGILQRFDRVGIPDEFRQLRITVSAGEHLPKDTGQRWSTEVGNVIDGIGATECLHIFAAGTPSSYTPGVTGRPLAGVEISVRDNDGISIDSGEAGHLHVKSEFCSSQYWDDPTTTASTMVDDWVRTGDIAELDDAGSLTYVGRSDDLFNVGGMKVAPLRIEEEARLLPGVGDALCIPKSDSDGLVAPLLLLVPDSSDSAEESDDNNQDTIEIQIRRELLRKLEPHEMPKFVQKVDVLPTTPTGKVSRSSAIEKWGK